MRPAPTIAFAILTLLTASCAMPSLKLPGAPPPAPRPQWTDADFDCGAEPVHPAQETSKAVAEADIVDSVSWGRGCNLKLRERGKDAHRYDLLPSTTGAAAKASPK